MGVGCFLLLGFGVQGGLRIFRFIYTDTYINININIYIIHIYIYIYIYIYLFIYLFSYMCIQVVLEMILEVATGLFSRSSRVAQGFLGVFRGLGT